MIIQYTSKERDLLSRLMRAEAVGEGELGMMMVGNVGINRVLANCLTFKNIRTISEMMYQENQFAAINSPLFFANPTTKEKLLADRILRGEYYYPATNSLWFYAPGKDKTCSSTWYGFNFAGNYKNHCFYKPEPNTCKEIH